MKHAKRPEVREQRRRQVQDRRDQIEALIRQELQAKATMSCNGQFQCEPVRHAWELTRGSRERDARHAEFALRILCEDRGIAYDHPMMNALYNYSESIEAMRAMLDDPEAARARIRAAHEYEREQARGASEKRLAELRERAARKP